MDKRTEFKLKFIDKEYYDWDMILRTTEPMTEEEIISLVREYAAIVSDMDEYDDIGYCPTDIMDELCDAKGWNWEDGDYQVIEIADWG